MTINDSLQYSDIKILEESWLLLQVDALILLQIFLDGAPRTGIRHCCRADDIDSLKGVAIVIYADVLEGHAFSASTGSNTDPPERRRQEMLEATSWRVPVD